MVHSWQKCFGLVIVARHFLLSQEIFAAERQNMYTSLKSPNIWQHTSIFNSMAVLGIFVQKIFETNFNFRYKQVRNLKKRWRLILTLQKCLYFFGFFTSWYLKLEFASNTFWTKVTKSSHCVKKKSVLMILLGSHKQF